MANLKWPPIVERAAEIASSYSTPVTLRQLFYKLVSDGLLANTDSSYKTLSARTAEARRDGVFPALLDQGRTIRGLRSWTSPYSAVASLARGYRRDRRDGQDKVPWLVVEKATLLEQVEQWVGEFGIPVVALRGYGSQTIVDEIRDEVEHDGRPAIALYLGDFDPTGEDIERDLQNRTDWCFDEVRRLAVTYDQIGEYGLVPAPGKRTDTRAGRFVAKYGELIQVEVEAIDPAILERLVFDAVESFVDYAALNRVLDIEATERELLAAAAESLRAVEL